MSELRRACAAGAPSAARSMRCSNRRAPAAASRSWFVGTPASARPRCSTTWRNGRQAARWRASPVSSRRWASRSPGCCSCCAACSNAPSSCRPRNATRSAVPSASWTGRRPRRSWSASPHSTCSARWPRTVRSSAWSTMPSGWTGNPLPRSRSSVVVSPLRGSRCCSRFAIPLPSRISRACRSSSSGASATPTPVYSWTRRSPEGSMTRFASGSSPRRTATRSRCWSCREG